MTISENLSSTIANNGAALDHNVEKASAAAHDTINKVADAARPAVDRFTAGAHQAVEKIKSVANATADTVSQKSEMLMDAQERLAEECRVYVRQKPVTSLAIAAGVGFVISMLFRRRN